jgi:hypothetical protein
MSPIWWITWVSIALNFTNAAWCGFGFSNWWAAGYWLGAAWMTYTAMMAVQWMGK